MHATEPSLERPECYGHLSECGRPGTTKIRRRFEIAEPIISLFVFLFFRIDFGVAVAVELAAARDARESRAGRARGQRWRQPNAQLRTDHSGREHSRTYRSLSSINLVIC